MRLGILRIFGERLAAASGWQREDPAADDLLLRAQVVLSVAVGIAVLRASGGLEPLASATQAELADPVRDLVQALLGGTAG